MVVCSRRTSGRNIAAKLPIRERYALRGPPELGATAKPSHVSVIIDGWLKTDANLDAVGVRDQWAERGDALLDRAVGDYALIVWDSASRRLWLARSPLSSRPLFYFKHDDGSVAVSSLASDLAGSARSIDYEAVARWYGALVGTSIEPMFTNVQRVEPGTIVTITPMGQSCRRFWGVQTIEPARGMSDRQLADQLRHALEAAIDDAIAEGSIASLLSAGRDSGCVSALAASRLANCGRTIDCFTSTPNLGTSLNDQGRLIDEAEGAAMVARRFPNIRHHLVTPRGVKFCAAVEAVYRHHSAPLGNPLSLYWWMQIQAEAAAARCDTILTGGMGNLTISDGGPSYLAELVGEGEWRRWLTGARDAASFDGASWLNIINVSFGGRLPRSAYSVAQRLYGRRLPPHVSPFLRGPLKAAVEAAHRSQDQRPPARPRYRGQVMLDSMELGDIASDLMFGVRMHDPTADRRVVEAAFAIPPERLVSRYDRRPIFELAFGDLLPIETIRAPRRAYQSMDWNLAYDVEELRQGLSRYADHRSVRECLNVEAMMKGLERWPIGRLPTLEETGVIGEGLLRAFALAAFLWVHTQA